MNPTNKPRLRTAHMSLFPSMDSLEEVVSMAEAKLGGDTNTLKTALLTYHNTLINLMNK
jgi:hypothetical protein